MVVIHLTGAVNREGVFRLKAGDRLLDALILAGGARPTADLSSLNLAEPLKDGAKIVIPEKIYLKITNNPATDVVSLNSANEEQLDALPGIGKSTAKQIIDYRQKHGPFAKIEQLLEIPRFGKAKLDRMKDKITL
jgi:competence protein ComEA